MGESILNTIALEKKAVLADDYALIKNIEDSLLWQMVSKSKSGKEFIGMNKIFFLTTLERLQIQRVFIDFIEIVNSYNHYNTDSIEYAAFAESINKIKGYLEGIYRYQGHDDESNVYFYNHIKQNFSSLFFNFAYWKEYWR